MTPVARLGRSACLLKGQPGRSLSVRLTVAVVLSASLHGGIIGVRPARVELLGTSRSDAPQVSPVEVVFDDRPDEARAQRIATEADDRVPSIRQATGMAVAVMDAPAATQAQARRGGPQGGPQRKHSGEEAAHVAELDPEEVSGTDATAGAARTPPDGEPTGVSGSSGRDAVERSALASRTAGDGRSSARTNATTTAPEEHWHRIREAVMRRVVYPQVARRMGWQGKVVLRFRVGSDGRADRTSVVESSGYRMLDESAMAAIARAEPFPGLGGTTDVVMPIVFALQ